MKTKLLIIVAFVALSVKGQQMIPLFELFTSSTCAPCNAGNANFKNVVSGKPINDYVAVRYQQDFPGIGDPYTTTEGVMKRTSYSIPTIPRLMINGGWNQSTSNFTNSLYNNARAAIPQYELNGTYNINHSNKTVNITINYRTTGTVVSPSLHIAIIENLTTNNIKTNGETQFENVVKAMIPSAMGTFINPSNSWQTISYTFAFHGNYRLPVDGQQANRINNAIEHSVEEFTDIRVVAWVQGINKTIYQATNLVLNLSSNVQEPESTTIVSDINIYPNPLSNEGLLEFYLNKSTTVSITLVNSLGQIVKIDDLKTLDIGNQKYKIETNTLANGLYFLHIKTGNIITTKKLTVAK